MFLTRHSKKRRGGFTLIDMIRGIPGGCLGFWIGSYFHGAWRVPMEIILSGIFSIGSLMLVYFCWWRLSLMRSRQKDLPSSHDDKPAA
jgi:hypothetical protein